MDSPYDHDAANEADTTGRQREVDIRSMLERGRLDMAEGRTVTLAPVLDRMRAAAERVRSQRRD